MSAYLSGKPLLNAVEAALDANYHNCALPHQNRTIATWYLLAVLEDNLRMLFVGLNDEQTAKIDYHLDGFKYSARFALDRIRRECLDTNKAALPSRVVPRLYSQTSSLLSAGLDFMLATRLCSAVHAGTLSLRECDESIEVMFDEAVHDMRYSTLELLGHVPLDFLDHVSNLYGWSRKKEFRPEIVDAIANTVRIFDRKILYSYQSELAILLANEMAQYPFLVPDGWRFDWGGREETTLLINALCIRCMYHWVAIHFGASLRRLKGGGHQSLLFVTTVQQLAFDLREMCSLKLPVIRKFIQFLTLGYAIEAPDPALQPIIPLGEGRLAIPCLLFLSANHERNLLSLQARVDAASFDRLSGLFEHEMVAGLLPEIRLRWPKSMANLTVRDGTEFEEVDLLMPELESKTLLICELRWMLQPGDPREVQNRKKVCWQKVVQLQRKIDWLKIRKGLVLKSLDIDADDADEWSIFGVVTIDAFGGVLSTNPELPILTKNIFKLGLQKTHSLNEFASWSQSLSWLPKRDIHFCVVTQRTVLPGFHKPLVTFGIDKLCSPRTYSQFVEQSIGAKDLTNHT